ncbi:MAG: reductase [Rubrobacteraceae bacterium]|nr:reductase [Rubrobacteraceae bacterium]
MISYNGRLRVVGSTLREGSSSLGALRRALSAEEAGAEVELFDLRELGLPMYEPGRPLEDYGSEVRRFVEAIGGADALIISTAAYHGTLAGVTKNALDFTQFLAGEERPYLEGRVVGLISTAGGDRAAANTTDAMVHIVHALRGVVAPQMVNMGQARRRTDAGNVTDEGYGRRLDRLGGLFVEMAGGLSVARGSHGRAGEALGVAV